MSGLSFGDRLVSGSFLLISPLCCCGHSTGIGQQALKHLVSSALWGGAVFYIDNPSRSISLLTELARCVSIVCPFLSPLQLLDGSRHAISMFEDDVVLVHEQRLPPPADCGSAPDVSSIITTAEFSPDLSLASSVSAVVSKRGRGRESGSFIVFSELCIIRTC